ncbi:MAG: J domain-containing protein [Cytophagales bacterium]|nr:J domain-containing protein [Cytophagales bacterium]
MNYYHILGLSQNATPGEIKKKFRQLAKQHHPDKGGNDLYFQKINEAYQTLSDHKKRANYDFMMKNPRSFYTPQKQKKKQKDPQEPIRAKRYDEFTEKEKEDWKKRQEQYYRRSDKKFFNSFVITIIILVIVISICAYVDYTINTYKYQ